MTIDAAVRSSRRRIVLAVLAVATVAIGLVIHRSGGGVVGDVIGDALYAVLIYLLVALIAARCRPLAPALVSFVFCAGVELFQLTGIPREWGSALPRSASSSAPDSMDATSSSTRVPSPWPLSSTSRSAARQSSPRRETPQGALPKESALCEEVLTQPTSAR